MVQSAEERHPTPNQGDLHVATVAIEQPGPRPNPPEPDGLYEVVDGRIAEKPVGVHECWLAGQFYRVLDRHAVVNSLGRVVLEMIFNLRPRIDRERHPEVAYVSYERWAVDRRIPRNAAWAVIPDLAVEVVSPSNAAEHVTEKVEEYFEVGVRQVWVVFPNQRKIYVYSSSSSVRILTQEDELDGGDVLPGFRLAAATLFDEAGEPE